MGRVDGNIRELCTTLQSTNRRLNRREARQRAEVGRLDCACGELDYWRATQLRSITRKCCARGNDVCKPGRWHRGAEADAAGLLHDTRQSLYTEPLFKRLDLRE